MNKNLTYLKKELFDKQNLEFTNYNEESESQEYDACQFELNKKQVISRTSKITPKKIGQFVTFWKRDYNGPIAPFSELDAFDYFMISSIWDKRFGLFVFPRDILIKKGIISTTNKEGKRGFRIYPSWDEVQSKQAERTQKWQLNYFYSINNAEDLIKLNHLFLG
ncbi:MepB family protein [Tenacibaculum xiamenense]|uniref:MepB family protein n=1 Tax=Tenacibaculum xiamenense TaxID=1261553 RepID=UPI003894B63C